MQIDITKINQTIESLLNIQDLNLQSSILCLEEFYKDINFISNIEIDVVKSSNSNKLNYLFYKGDTIQHIGIDFFSDVIYEPFFIPMQAISEYYKNTLLEFNQIKNPNERFNFYRNIYSQYHKNNKSLEFLKTIDFLEEQNLSNDPYSIINNLRGLIKEDSYNIPTFFSSYDNCCKLNKYGGINEDIYEQLSADYFEIKLELLYFINEAAINLNLLHNNNVLFISDIYNNIDTLQKKLPTLYDNIITLSTLKSKIENFLKEEFEFNPLNFKEISLFNKEQCQEYLNNYFQNMNLEDNINSFLNTIQISQEKNLLDKTINNDGKKLKNRL